MPKAKGREVFVEIKPISVWFEIAENLTAYINLTRFKKADIVN